MTISASLSNALSGLAVASRAAELVSSNVANAMTEGYGRRALDVQQRMSGGVDVTGVRREVDSVIVRDRRLADADFGYSDAKAGFQADLERILGTPDDANSLSGRIARLEATLIEAGSRPDSPGRLDAAVRAAQAMVDSLNTASREIQSARADADSGIAAQVERLNSGLARVEALNIQIQETVARGKDPSPLVDQRQQTIDDLSSIVPLKSADRGRGMIALFTTGGAVLLDGRATRLSFDPSRVIVPDMSAASGALSGLEINGNPISTSGARSPIAGGSLAALFEIRDTTATKAQAQLDQVARDLVERFQDPAIDATRAVGDAGLFTDDGAVFDAVNETGLSSRIALNEALLPATGGGSWRLRDGLGAATPGNVGDSSLLVDLKSALVTPRAAAGAPSSVARSASGNVADLVSMAGAARHDADERLSFAAARQDSLAFLELQTGVDTDEEMQKLMLIEQAYAANARVITTVGDMLDTLLGI